MRRLLLLLVLLLPGLGLAPLAAGAQSTASDAITAIVDELEASGRSVDPAALPLATGVDAAIGRANAAGIAVVLPDPASDAQKLTLAVDEAMRSSGSRFDSVLVLTPTVIAAEVGDVSEAELDAALDAAFATAGDADAIDAFVASLTGENPPATTATTTATDTDTDTGNSTSGATDTGTGTDNTDSGGGFPWLFVILVAIAGFFGLRFFTNRRKRRAAEQAAIEVDRAEIAEQLRNNADRVIDLGDPVIATKDAELIALYEQASATYQEVSLALPDATTAAEIDALDDRIDEAEWQLEVIAARLAGEPEPLSPAERERAAMPPAPTGPALGPDDSVFGPRPSGRTSSSRLPPPQPQPAPRRRSSRGGGMSSGMGGMLGSILGQILLGGGRPRTTSRRTQRRTASSGGFGGAFGSPRRSSSSFPDPFGRSNRSSGGGLGRSRSSRSSGARSSGTRRAGGSRNRSTSSRRAGGSRRR
ncbi:MAG: hypothetical protein R2733_03180 [Acidimicrobiales bacterium]